ncbi:hypothetical protein EDB92DRAFT_1867574 [Lactarius akahatsu]|uniref:Uncharacterized protein n=1 Tax=Lactarius akahatsu TaxID=416441 RepID=A0AAD4LDS9_9AGAM|nr:hypothetical protein EDB92DRAFT_1867574 [Lactarius akahatsu]
MTTIGRSHGISSDQFAGFTPFYIEIPMLPLQLSPLPPATRTTFCGNQLRIHCVTSLVIIPTLHFTSTMTLSPHSLLLPARMMTLRCPPLPSPVPMRLPRPYQPHFMSSTASPMCHCLTNSNPFIKKSLKACTFPLPHQMQPPVVQYRTLSPQSYRCPTPLPDL